MSEERYEITQLLGKGRTGGVYEAEDTVLQRKVAMRRFFSQTGASGANDYQAEFENIARSLGALQHPNLLTVYDAGSDDDGPFMIGQLLSGQSLTDKIAEASKLTPQEAHDLAYQILDALTAAHAAGFHHGAITPGSIMLTPRARGGDRFVILDLGLSRLAPLIQGQDSILAMMADTATMAPELFSGQPTSAKSDLYMLGHLIYFCLLGGHPFAGLSQEDAAAWHQSGIPHLSTVNPEFQGPFYDWIATLTQPDPTYRPESAVAALQSLPPAPQIPHAQIPPQPNIAGAAPMATIIQPSAAQATPPPTIATAQATPPPTASYASPQAAAQPPSISLYPSPVVPNSTLPLEGGDQEAAKKKKKFIFIGVAALGALLIAIIFALGGKDDPAEQPSIVTETTPVKEQPKVVEPPKPKKKKVFKNVTEFHFGKEAYEKGVLSDNSHANSRPQQRIQFRNSFIAFNHGQHFLSPSKKASNLIAPNRVALAAYVYLDELQPKTPLVSYYDDSNTPYQGFHLSIEGGSYVLGFTTGRENYRIESPGAKAKTWTQVAFTYSSGDLKFFIDGQRVGQIPTLLASIKIPTESDLLFGAIKHGEELSTMSGVIRSVKVSPNPSSEQIESWWEIEQEAKSNEVSLDKIPTPFPNIPTIDIGKVIEAKWQEQQKK